MTLPSESCVNFRVKLYKREKGKVLDSWSVLAKTVAGKYVGMTFGMTRGEAIEKMMKLMGTPNLYAEDREDAHYERLVYTYCKYGPHSLTMFDRMFINDYQRHKAGVAQR